MALKMTQHLWRALLLLAALLSSTGASRAQPTPPAAPPDDAVVAYLTVIAAMNERVLVTDYDGFAYAPTGTMVDILADQRNGFAARLATLNALTPPSSLAALHTRYVASLDAASAAVARALVNADPRAAAEAGPGTLYRTPEFGYAFDDENAVVCAMKRVTDAQGISAFPSLLCGNPPPTGPGQTLGSPTAPVNTVTLVHAQGCGGLCPRITYKVTTIYAQANAPVTITFDNRNPFLFNLALYEGWLPDERLNADRLIMATNAGGPRTHIISLTLPAGEYTYADNVHPGFMPGRLIVVDSPQVGAPATSPLG